MGVVGEIETDGEDDREVESDDREIGAGKSELRHGAVGPRR